MALTPDQLVKNSKTEHSIQTAFFCWLNTVKLPDTEWVHAIPNGGARSAASAGRLKAEGVKTGVWDVFVPIPIPDEGYIGMYIEFKRPEHRNHKNGGMTDEQFVFGQWAHSKNYKLKLAYTWREAAQALCNYLEVPFQDIIG